MSDILTTLAVLIAATIMFRAMVKDSEPPRRSFLGPPEELTRLRLWSLIIAGVVFWAPLLIGLALTGNTASWLVKFTVAFLNSSPETMLGTLFLTLAVLACWIGATMLILSLASTIGPPHPPRPALQAAPTEQRNHRVRYQVRTKK